MDEPKRTNDPDGLRRRVIEVAFRAFTTKGYNATSVHDLRREAGVTGGAYSHHFPTKKSLARAVMDHCVGQAVDEAWLKPVEQASSTLEGVRHAFAGIVADLDRKGSVAGCPLNNMTLELAGQDREIAESSDALFARWIACLTAKMVADRTAGRAHYKDPQATACLVVAAYSGAMAMAKANQSTAPLRICGAQIATYLSAVAALDAEGDARIPE